MKTNYSEVDLNFILNLNCFSNFEVSENSICLGKPKTISSQLLKFKNPMDYNKVFETISEILYESEEGEIFRCKGIFCDEENYLLQGVGQIFEIEKFDSEDVTGEAKFLFIGKNVNSTKISNRLEKCEKCKE